MKIALAQFNPTVGDLAENAARLAAWSREAHAAGAEVLVSPELGLCGYPPEDLALRHDFYAENAAYLQKLAREIPAGLALVVGYPLMEGDSRYNAASVLIPG